MKKFKFVSDKIQVAQVNTDNISGSLKSELRRNAAFIDIDKDLNEFIISVARLARLLIEYENQKHHSKLINSLFRESYDLFHEVKNFQYIQITTI